MAMMRTYSSRKSGGITSVQKMPTPGVGAYNLTSHFVSPRIPGGSFTREKRESTNLKN